MKYKLLVLFSIIGVLSLIYFIVKIVNDYNKNETRFQYDLNCQNLKVGMTLDEARKVMGDLKYKYWYADDKSGEIIVNERDTIVYSLEYPMKFGGSDNTKIEFNPNTLIVTKIICGE